MRSQFLAVSTFSRRIWLLVAASLLVLPSCLLLSEAPERPDNLGEDAGSSDLADSDAAGDLAEDDAPDQSDDSAGDDLTGFASLNGNVTRSREPGSGGIGTLYIAVLEQNPITSPGTEIVGFAAIADADMSEAEASIEYNIENIPASSDEYFILAFLDDDNNASAVYPLPADPDLVALEGGVGVSLPTVVLDEARAFTRDIVLNLPYPL